MTVDELLAQVNAKIDEIGIQVPEGSRAGRYVDLRSFRFYRNQGLVNPPNEKRGVVGLYSERHVWQLVAVKAMQARWIPLPEIRRQLADASDEVLRASVVPPETASRPAGQTAEAVKPRTPNRPRTWVELRASDEAFLMVDEAMLKHSKPSTLRALGAQFTSLLLTAGG
jgi:DNA-binding transcriptional MerR regulator